MTKTEKIDDLLLDLASKKLSGLLPIMSSLALEHQDYVGFCMFFFWGKPIMANTQEQMDSTDVEKSLEEAGVSDADERMTIMRNAFKRYLSSRMVAKDQMSSSTAQELEDQMLHYEDMMKVCDTPQNLHPTDLYFRSAEDEKIKSKLIAAQLERKKQYAVLRSLMAEKLNLYRAKAVREENRQEVESVIMGSKKVFIIHGHSEAKRRELEKIIESLGLTPVVLGEKPNQGMTIIEKFEHYATECGFAFALFTPDDIIQTDDGKEYFQARPNVIFELGWFYSHLGRAKTCIISQASEKNNIFSDLQGVMRIQFNQNIEESYLQIKRELASANMI